MESKDEYLFVQQQNGCDTGFVHGLAIELDHQDFNVLADIYNPSNQNSLIERLSSRTTVFKLDITRQEDIDAAYEMISTKTKTLHALVNNAGIGYGGFIDWITVESMRKMMDINFFGHVTMTKKILPLLISKKDSRVVNICSIGGYLATPGITIIFTLAIVAPNPSAGVRKQLQS